MAPTTPLKILQDAMLTKLATSLLDAKDAKALDFEALLPNQVVYLLPRAPAKMAFKIPYFDIDGLPLDFFRLRYLESTLNGFDKITHQKERRYTQPLGLEPQIYLPPNHPKKETTWLTLSQDPAKPLLITEGELKAACATKHGFPTIGLGGVWNFRCAAAGQALLPIFLKFAWKDREIYIIYDSDAIHNHKVAAAENALAEELTRLGAIVRITRIPTIGKVKIGLDDYILAHGRDALINLINDPKQTSQWERNKTLHQLNQEVVFIADPPHVVRVQKMQSLSVSEFCNLYAPLCWVEILQKERLTKDGPVTASATIKHDPANEWLRWPVRPTLERIAYRPGEPEICESSKGELELNGWTGWAIKEPRAGNIDPFLKLFDFVTKKEPQYRKWLMQWFAYPIQHPGTKLFTSVVVWGKMRGTGKSLLGITMRGIYGDNWTLIDDEDLDSQFNEWAARKQFAVSDEITGSDNHALANKIKRMITRDVIRVNEKNLKKYTIQDCTNYYFTSQHSNAIFIDHNSERRFFVIELAGPPMEDAFYKRYEEWMYSDPINRVFREESMAALMHHFLNVDVSDFNPHVKAPFTESATDMVEDGMSDLALLAARLRDSPESILQLDGCVSKRCLWTTREILAVIKEEHPRLTENGLSRALKHAGLEKVNGGQPIFIAKGVAQKLWAIFDREKMLSLSQKDAAGLYRRERELEPIVEDKPRKFDAPVRKASGKKREKEKVL
jgi:Domain of unknown function (DUF3854)/Family of unknown function (DUF5906)